MKLKKYQINYQINGVNKIEFIHAVNRNAAIKTAKALGINPIKKSKL